MLICCVTKVRENEAKLVVEDLSEVEFVCVFLGMPAGPSLMAFPWILSVFEIHGYEFYKVLESFIKAEPRLTRDVVRVGHFYFFQKRQIT